MALRIGLDIGGTKTELAALDPEGRECLRRRVPTPHGSYEQALAHLAATVLDAESELGERASVGIGLPGAVSRASGLVKSAFATPYNGRPLKRDLERLLARELRFENDANCFALSETADGAACGAGSVFGAILGTGAGGGLVIDGRVVGGANGIGGEWGHNPLPWMEPGEYPGPPCYCGRRGCIEQFVSGPALAADHERSERERLEPAAIAARAAAGNAGCRRSLARLESRLARAFAHVINLLDPEIIVVGGGLSTVARIYANVPKLWGAFIYSDSVATKLLPAAHGDASGVRGAARLWDAPAGQGIKP
ncbi:MAG TPA: ROK family protein [Burkholderiales bacterium]|jgi:predicted NBD/HSP70 family sugar kinase